MRSLKLVLLVLLVLFAAIVATSAVAVLIYLVINIRAEVSAHGKRDALSERITERLSEELASSQQRAELVAERAGAEPVHSWTAQSCELETIDAGWIVQDYREVCSLESAHAWQVDSEAEAFALVDDQLTAGEQPSVNGACHVYRDPDAAYGEGLSFLYIEPSAEVDRWCEPTDRGYAQRRAVVGDLPELDNSLGWLVAVDDTELVNAVIGCTHWSVIFCDNPFGDELAWGEPPSQL